MQLKTSAEVVLKEIESIAQQQFLPIIGPVKGKFLADTVRKYKPERVLEVGTLVGYSAILMASNLPDNAKVFTIEINTQSAHRAEENIIKANLKDKIEVYPGNALKVIPEIKEQFGMIFIDAAKTEYFAYLKLCESKLKKSGIVFADNVKIFTGEMQDYLDYVRNSGKYQSQFIDAGLDGVEISIKQF